ncbi:MAG: ABC transporter permease [Treponema sp.]|nr:ABC transporter permease [Candidatus Treponema equi]
MLKKLGVYIRSQFSSPGYLVGYVGRVFKSSFFFITHEKSARKILIMQLLFTFIEALPIIAMLSTALGSALYLVGYQFLLSFGQESLIYSVLVMAIVQEIGPLLVAFVVTARSATAIATEIGGMVISHQIESYISFGIDPISYLVAPRFIGVTASVFFLNLYFCLCGTFGPFFVSLIVSPVTAADYLAGILKAFDLVTIGVSTIKSLVFGMIISIASTYFGFNVNRASTEIPVAGIASVTKSFMNIILADVIIILLVFLR